MDPLSKLLGNLPGALGIVGGLVGTVVWGWNESNGVAECKSTRFGIEYYYEPHFLTGCSDGDFVVKRTWFERHGAEALEWILPILVVICVIVVGVAVYQHYSRSRT